MVRDYGVMEAAGSEFAKEDKRHKLCCGSYLICGFLPFGDII